MDRHRADSTIAFHLQENQDGQARIVREPTKVLEGIRSEMTKWFNELYYPELSDVWEAAFAPLQGIDGSIWVGLMKWIQADELSAAFQAVEMAKGSVRTG